MSRCLVFVVLVSLAVSASVRAGDGVIDFDNLPDSPGRSLYGANLLAACSGEEPAATCRFSIGAVLDTLDLLEAEHPEARIYCPSVRPVPVEDARRALMAWAERNPGIHRGPGAWLILEALREAYPCPEGKA